MKIAAICLFWVLLLLAVTGNAQPVTNVAAGDEHSLFLKSDGSLWAMGRNYYGQLGSGIFDIYNYDFNQTNRPEQIVASGVTAVVGGYGHSLFLKTNGSLWAMGWNYYGQFGDGTTIYRTIPKQIVAGGVTAIAAGYAHSLFLKNDGSLWAIGYNYSGQLGDGGNNQTNRPEQIVPSGVTAIAAGDQHSLFLKSDGSLWGMGMNLSGQLGDGTYSTNAPYGTNRPEQIISSGVTAIAAGAGHSLFLKCDGSLWAMGANGFGELGAGSSNYQTNRPTQIVSNGVTAIAAGNEHSLFLKNDGSLWGVGLNNLGQLGDGTNSYLTIPTQIVASGVTAIAAGKYHSLFCKNDGSLWAMGWNIYGQLGNGTTGNTNYPEQIIGPGFNQISVQILLGGKLRLSFVGNAGANYALDRTFKLLPANWVPQSTNPAGAGGVLLFTNSPNTNTNNFWRVRSVP